ncbi:hypothetical protein B5S29_g5194 [[Candida] boidinii]|nr:hypothetical protein B5S29_g5194 [[Candida] boidinii]
MTKISETTEEFLQQLEMMNNQMEKNMQYQSVISDRLNILYETTEKLSLNVNSTNNQEQLLNNDNDITEQFEKMDLNNEQNDDSLNYIKQAIENIQNDFKSPQDTQAINYAELEKMNDLATSNNERVMQRINHNISYKKIQLQNRLNGFDGTPPVHKENLLELKNESHAFFNQVLSDLRVPKDFKISSENEVEHDIPTEKRLNFSSIDEIYNTIRQIERCFPYLNIIESEPFGRSKRFDYSLTANFTKEIINHNDSIVSKFSKIYNLQSELKQFCIAPTDWHDRLRAIIYPISHSESTPLYISNYQEALKDIYYDGQKLGDWGKLLVAIFYPHQIECETYFYINTLINSSTIEPNTSAHCWAIELCSELKRFYNLVPFKQLFFKIYNEFKQRSIEFGFCENYENCNSIEDLIWFLKRHADEVDAMIRAYPDYTPESTSGDVIEADMSEALSMDYDRLVRIRTEAEQRQNGFE